MLPSRFSLFSKADVTGAAAMKRISFLLFGVTMLGCGAKSDCMSGTCADGGLLINEVAATGGDFIELFNASNQAQDLSGFGLADLADGGIRYESALRFANGAQIEPRGRLTVFLEADCPATVTPCVRGEFGVSQSTGDTITLLDARNETVTQAQYPPGAAPSGSSWARAFDGAPTFQVQRRSPGAANAP
jgi:hypothetical protein